MLAGSLLGVVAFCALYAAMLTSAFFVRSAALSAATGVGTLILGVMSSYRESIADVLNSGLGRQAFRVAMMPFPRLALLANASAQYAAGTPMNVEMMVRLIVGAFIFAAALLSVAAWRFERSDY